jgi:hypothetical protein
VSSVGTCQVQTEKLDSPLSGGASVIGVAVPTAGAGAAKGISSSRQEAKESRGSSGMIDEGLGVRREVAAGVGVKGWAGVMGG